MSAFVTAGAGFLLAVLWFDLMFDVQVRGEGEVVSEEVLASMVDKRLVSVKCSGRGKASVSRRPLAAASS